MHSDEANLAVNDLANELSTAIRLGDVREEDSFEQRLDDGNRRLEAAGFYEIYDERPQPDASLRRPSPPAEQRASGSTMTGNRRSRADPVPPPSTSSTLRRRTAALCRRHRESSRPPLATKASASSTMSFR